MRKRILVVTQHFWPENFRINDIVEGFLDDGIEVDVLCGLPNYPKGEWFDGYDSHGPFEEHYRLPLQRDPPQGQHRGAHLFELCQLAVERPVGAFPAAGRLRRGVLLQHQPGFDVLAGGGLC